MGQRIAGIATFKVDGRQFALKGNFTVSPSGTERTGIAGQDYVHGFSEMPRVPFISGDVSLTADLSVEEIALITNATVQADLANGRSYVLIEAWCTSAFELNTAEGQVTIRFEGTECKEI